MKAIEFINAIRKGIGRRPTSVLLRWCPTFKSPFKFDLIEVRKCEADGGIVTNKIAQSHAGDHLGHRIKSPSYFSLTEFLKIQLRIIR